MLEDSHWWFVGRRRILGAIAERFNLFDSEARVLDAGCGTGGTLRWLKGKGVKSFGFEPERRVVKRVVRSGLDVRYGQLPNEVPDYKDLFDVVLSLDVLEHIADDALSLDSMHALLRPGGHLLLTVPSFQFLWSAHDILNHHYRRYRRQQLKTMLEERGFQVQYASYYNAFLFPIIAVLRKLKLQRSGDLHSTTPWLNAILTGIFAAESNFIQSGCRFPFGVSLVFVARKEQNKDACINSITCTQ